MKLAKQEIKLIIICIKSEIKAIDSCIGDNKESDKEFRKDQKVLRSLIKKLST